MFGLCPACFFFFNDTATTEIYTLSLHDALPIYPARRARGRRACTRRAAPACTPAAPRGSARDSTPSGTGADTAPSGPTGAPAPTGAPRPPSGRPAPSFAGHHNWDTTPVLYTRTVPG